MLNFTILGIPVRVQPWFWITMALLGGGLSANDSTSMMLVLVFVFAGFLSILVHELGHALTIRKFGLPATITLQSFGGFASYPAGKLSRKESFIVTFAGPAGQFALGILLIFVGRMLPIPEGSLFGPFLHYLITISIIWAIFNCFPIYPLDGGQMLAAVLGPKRQKIVHLIGFGTAATLAVAGYMLYNSIFLPVFMALFAWQNWQAYQAVK